MMKIRSMVSVGACLVAASLAHAGEGCGSCGGGGVQVNSADRTTSALMLGASTFNLVDVAPLLAQRPLRAGVDDVRRPGFNGAAWNGNNPGAASDCYAAGYGAAGQEGSVILVHAGPRHIVALNPFAPVPTATADGQAMPPELLRNLESQRSKWLSDNGYTGGVRTFTNEKPDQPAKKDARLIKPRAIIELNPEAPRLKSRMQVRVMPAPSAPAPAVMGVATTGPKASEPKATDIKPANQKPVVASMKVAIATTNTPSSR